MASSIGKQIGIATLIAGTLDISLATIQTLYHGRKIDGMLRSVASGPFADATHWGVGGAVLGLAVHYALMAIMAAVFFIAASRLELIRRTPMLWGPLYGLATFVVLDLLIVPWRFGHPVFTTAAEPFIVQLFAHVVLVGVTFGLVARKG